VLVLSEALKTSRALLSLTFPPLSESSIDRTMIETNPIRTRIADLQGRIASLRGYL
jgi:hypothetical protein